MLVIYTLDAESDARATNLEVIVQEPWAIASHTRSSTTREYIGAVDDLEKLRSGGGEFADAAAFYRFWRAYPFKVSPQVRRTLQRLNEEKDTQLAAKDAEIAALKLAAHELQAGRTEIVTPE